MRVAIMEKPYSCIIDKLRVMARDHCSGSRVWWQEYPVEVGVVAAILSARTRREIIQKNIDRVEAIARLVDSGISRPEAYMDLVRPFGLYKSRSRTLAVLAATAARYGGLRGLLKSLGCGELVGVLLRVPGIGVKTARIIAVMKGCNYFVVDSNILRILNILGRDCGVQYRDIYEAMEELDGYFDYQESIRLHFCLMEMGRKHRGESIVVK